MNHHFTLHLYEIRHKKLLAIRLELKKRLHLKSAPPQIKIDEIWKQTFEATSKYKSRLERAQKGSAGELLARTRSLHSYALILNKKCRVRKLLLSVVLEPNVLAMSFKLKTIYVDLIP